MKKTLAEQMVERKAKRLQRRARMHDLQAELDRRLASQVNQWVSEARGLSIPTWALPVVGWTPSDSRWVNRLSILGIPAKVLGQYGQPAGKPPLFVRWALLRTRWFQVLVHCFLREDDRQLGVHDHPWSFASLVLSGAYLEEGPGHRRWRSRWSLGWHAATFQHVQVAGRWPCWTLCVTGPRVRAWGFPEVGIDDVPRVSYPEDGG